MANFKLTAALVSDIGMKRKQNQDHGLSEPELGLFMVADGMGGHKGGETASRMCVEKLAAHVVQNHTTEKNQALLLQQGMLIANDAIYDYALNHEGFEGMGTTATIIKIYDELAYIAQVGDSRAYYFTKAGMWQLTQDHSLVQEKLRAGLIERSQLKSDQNKNVITRSVGYEPNVKVDLFTFEIKPGDGFLICSDGLTGLVDDAAIFAVLEETWTSGLNLEGAAKKLVEQANANGGDDNVTVVLVNVE